ncbi:transcriptional regulator [Halorhodospira abdelmalekii]|uniref:helix-turn-helix domain-containing protein n=1 Tax=Halorhodospira abdelmalekii TaxID=421629 RepID=UPI00190489CB|nr:helix-turn-helix transcriptional regulator [Halorhodospira abdelmalekii]MBK1735513.1 transcriptional regulator [Halorhodospira abdelmalekii]
MKSHDKLRSKLLDNPEVREEYERLAPELELIDSLVRARTRAGLTQADLAKRMQTSQSVVARLEGGRTMPSLSTLRRYADATGSQLKVILESKA